MTLVSYWELEDRRIQRELSRQRRRQRRHSMLINENDYDDDVYTEASLALHGAIQGLWEAGATVKNVKDEIRDALEGSNLGGIARELGL